MTKHLRPVRRVVLAVVVTLATVLATLTLSTGTAEAAYTPQLAVNRTSVPVGGTAALDLRHWPAHQAGRVIMDQYVVRKVHRHGKVVYRKVLVHILLARFRTNIHGTHVLTFAVPKHGKFQPNLTPTPGHHPFRVIVAGKTRTFVLKVNG